MRHTKFRITVIPLLLIISLSALGQTHYYIEIAFSGTDVSQIKIGAQVYQGLQTLPLKKDSSNSMSATIALSAKNPILEISYFSPKHAPSIHRYFLRNQKCRLVVHYDKDADIIKLEKTSGVTSFEESGLREFEILAKDEIETRDAYGREYNHDFTNVDSNVLNNLTKYIEAVRDKGVQFVKMYPNSLYSTWLFIYELIGDPRYSKDELLDLYNKILKPIYKGSFEEKIILNKLDADRLAVNTKAPLQDKFFVDLQGSTYSISSLGKKLVLINVWATWCVPCVEEIPRLKEIYAKYKTSLEIVSFSTDKDEEKLRNFITARDTDWINVFNQPEFHGAFGSDMGIPQLFLLNEQGIIIYSRTGSADNTLDKLNKCGYLNLIPIVRSTLNFYI